MAEFRIYKHIFTNEYYDDNYIIDFLKDECQLDNFLYWVNMNFSASDIYNMMICRKDYSDSSEDYSDVWKELRQEFIEEQINNFCTDNYIIKIIDSRDCI